jgi:hypothetical protein
MFAESTCFSMMFLQVSPIFPIFSLVFVHLVVPSHVGSDAAHAGAALQPSEQSAALGRGTADLCGAAAGGAAPGEAENDGTTRAAGKHSGALDSG